MHAIIRPGLFRHLCKEPLDKVESVRLRGRGIAQLIGLDACPKLVSLDVSRNALTDLGETGIAECRALWILDVSHNNLETLAGLSSFMALGYLNLSNNPIPLEALRPIARSHVLELVLGRGCNPNERRPILRMLPNVWVLDEEYVTAKERRDAENSLQRGNSGGSTRNANDFLVSNDKTAREPVEGNAARNFGGKEEHREISARGGNRAPHGMACSYSRYYQNPARQSRRTQEFFDNVVWKIPCRAEKADSFRLVALLDCYDKRVVATNKHTWLSTFTRGANVPRRDWSVSLPRSHIGVLRSLPVGPRLDVAVLLAVRVAFRNTFQRQVLAEAFSILFMPHSGIPDGVHSDLSRIPPFVCTVLVHVLRSSILEDQAQASHEPRLGNDAANAPTSLDEMEREVLGALPPVVTGIDNALEEWNSRQKGPGSGNPGENPDVDEKLESPNRDSEPSLIAGKARSPPATKKAAIRARRLADTSTNTTTLGCDDESVPNAPGTNNGVSQGSAACAPPASIELMRLCRRAVILLTRSPTCPVLVERQKKSTNQRLYEQMAPLLARANMSYEDLHTGPQKDSTTVRLTGSADADGSREACGAHEENGLLPSSLLARRKKLYDREGFDLVGSEIDSSKLARPSFVQRFRSTDGSGWCPHIRLPKLGERVQVLHNSWSIIVSTSSSGTSATVANFSGIQDPPYCGVPNLDSRDLCYDPRGWWKHSAAFPTKQPPHNDWLHRSSRGVAVDGFPCGASSLKEAFVRLDDARCKNEDPVEVRAATTPEKCLQDTGDFRLSARNSASDHVGTDALCAASPSTRRFCSALDVFSAEGAWDPAFVVAPKRLIDLRNRVVARDKGFQRTDKRFAWRCIDDPEVTVGLRPMMPRCFSSELTIERDRGPWSASILGLRPSQAERGIGGSYPTPMLSTSRHGEGTCARGGLTRSNSMPSKITGNSVTVEPSATVRCAWIELRREMGSFKADNRMMSRGGDGANRGKGTRAYSRRVRTPMSKMSLETTMRAQNSDDFVEATALANILSKTFASPALNRRDSPSEAAVLKANISGRGVFELTQMEKRLSKLDDGAMSDFSPSVEAAITRVEDKSDEESTTTTKITSIDEIVQASTDLNETPKQNRQRGCSRAQGNTKTSAVVAAWKLNDNQPLEWFPVSARHRLLLDPGFIATTGPPGTAEMFPRRDGFSSLTTIRRDRGVDGTNDRDRECPHHRRGISRGKHGSERWGNEGSGK